MASTVTRVKSGKVSKIRATADQLPEAVQLQHCLSQLCKLVPSLQARLVADVGDGCPAIDCPSAEVDSRSVSVLQHVIDYISDLQDCLDEPPAHQDCGSEVKTVTEVC